MRLFPIHRFANALAEVLPSGADLRGLASAVLGSPGRSRQAIARWWRGLARPRRHLIVNLFIGLLIALLLTPLHHSQWLRDFEDAALDWVLAINTGTGRFSGGPGFAWIDAGDSTQIAWGEPPMFPRDALARLLTQILASDPTAVVVDIDLAFSGHDADADRQLVEILSQHARNCRSGPCPPVILVKTARLPHGAPPSWRESRVPGLEAVVSASPDLIWAVPYQERSSDLQVRRWRLWFSACDADGHIHSLPSIQLAVAVALGAKDRAAALRALDARLNDGRALCGAESDNHGPTMDPLTIAPSGDSSRQTLRWDNSPIGRRIVFDMPGLTRIPSWERSNGTTAPLLVRIPAIDLLGASDSPIGPVTGRIALLGASHFDAGDMHKTPVGWMPGTLVVANTIHSLVRYGETRSVPMWVKLLIEAALIVLMAVIFQRFRSFWGMVASAVSVLVVLMPLSLWLFNYGVWLDFALPLIAVQLHEIAAAFEEKLHAGKTQDQR